MSFSASASSSCSSSASRVSGSPSKTVLSVLPMYECEDNRESPSDRCLGADDLPSLATLRQAE